MADHGEGATEQLALEDPPQAESSPDGSKDRKSPDGSKDRKSSRKSSRRSESETVTSPMSSLDADAEAEAMGAPTEEELIARLDMLEDEEATFEMLRKTGGKAPVPLVEQQWFSLIMGGIVLVNTVIIGIELEAGDGEELKTFFLIINNSFLLCYLSELFLRFLSRGAQAAKDTLTLLDIALIFLSFVERFASGGSLGKSLPSIRLLRLLRLIRTFKAMAQSKELTVLMSTSSRAGYTLFWTISFLFAIVWCAAAVTRKVFGESAEWNGSMNPMVEHEAFSSFDNRQYYGSVGAAFLTNLQIVTNSQWAKQVGRPVFLKYPITGVFFIFYCFSTTFGLVVCVISNLVQDSIESSRALESSLNELQRENRQMAGLRAKRLLQMIDEDGDGELGIEEMEKALENKEFLKILRILEVPVLDAEGLIRLFDVDGSGSVSFSELVDGITSMLDEINSRDYTKLALWSLSLTMRTELLEAKVGKVLRSIKELRLQLLFAIESMDHFILNRRSTDMYYRALKLIREAPPPMPVDIKTALRIVEKEEEPPEDEFEQVLNFARRYVAPKPPDKRGGPSSPTGSNYKPHTGLRVAATLVNHKAVLKEAPPSMPDAMRLRSKEEKMLKEVDGAYQISAANGFRPSPKYSALKDLLGGT